MCLSIGQREMCALMLQSFPEQQGEQKAPAPSLSPATLGLKCSAQWALVWVSHTSTALLMELTD